MLHVAHELLGRHPHARDTTGSACRYVVKTYLWFSDSPLNDNVLAARNGRILRSGIELPVTACDRGCCTQCD